jgi:hypothetical protein
MVEEVVSEWSVEACCAFDALSEDEWDELVDEVDRMSLAELRALEREMEAELVMEVRRRLRADRGVPRASARESRGRRRVARGARSSDDPDPPDALAGRRAKTRVKVAAWRARHRELCPYCGEFFSRLDEFTGWCWLCTRADERKRVAA